MRRSLWRPAAIAACLMVVIACGPNVSTPPPSTSGSEPPRTPNSSPSPAATADALGDCGQPIEVAPPQSSRGNSRAAFSTPNGLALYDIQADAVTSTAEPSSPATPGPRFRTDTEVSVVRRREEADPTHTFGQDSIYEFDTQTGQSTELLRLPNIVLGYEWSRDGAALTYLLQVETSSEIGPRHLCVLDSGTDQVRLLRLIDRPFGTGTSQREESSVIWAPDGRHILAVETAADPSVFVVDMAGNDLIAPQSGTFGRWLSATTIVFQQNPHDTTQPWPWFSVSLGDGRKEAIDLPADAYRPQVSPTGDGVAFDDGGSDAKPPATFVFDVNTGKVRRVGSGLVAPVWLSRGLLAAAEAKRSPQPGFGAPPWTTTGTVLGFNGAGQRPLTLPTTLQDVLRFGTIDIYLASE